MQTLRKLTQPFGLVRRALKKIIHIQHEAGALLRSLDSFPSGHADRLVSESFPAFLSLSNDGYLTSSSTIAVTSFCVILKTLQLYAKVLCPFFYQHTCKIQPLFDHLRTEPFFCEKFYYRSIFELRLLYAQKGVAF